MVAVIQGNPDKIPEVDDFIKQNMSYMYSGSCKTKPNFCYDEGSGTLYRLTSEGRREVVHGNRAREITFTVCKAEHVGKMGSMQL